MNHNRNTNIHAYFTDKFGGGRKFLSNLISVVHHRSLLIIESMASETEETR